MTFAEFFRYLNAWEIERQSELNLWRIGIVTQINTHAKSGSGVTAREIIELPLYDEEIKILPENVAKMKEKWQQL